MDATKAAELSGYKCKTRQALINKAHRLKNRPDIKQYINKVLKQQHIENMASIEETMSYLSSAMRGEEREEVVVVLKSGDRDGFSDEVETVDIKIKPKDRINAAKIIVDYYKEEKRTNQNKHEDGLKIVNDVPLENKKKVSDDAGNQTN